jgi:U3 small nucleolar RNA-associated protein 14
MNGQASAPISKTTAGTGDRDHATTSQAAKAPKHKSKPSESQLDDYTSPSESEDGEDSRAALARSIFAGPDEVIQDFAKEKKKTVEDEEDKVIDNSLPGWGSWTGNGISKKAQKRAKGKFLTTIKGVSEDKRKDAKLDRVIINEKRVKKNDKYLATELPHPFESRAQYERSLRLPLGPEFQTKISFQDAIKPRLLMKQGIIKPMARPSA